MRSTATGATLRWTASPDIQDCIGDTPCLTSSAPSGSFVKDTLTSKREARKQDFEEVSVLGYTNLPGSTLKWPNVIFLNGQWM